MDVPKEEIKFSIPLKPITDPDEFSERFLPQALTDEYCTRYLEHIGATPTKANRDMVKKSIPLTNNCIRPHLRTKGYAKDEVVIVVPPVEHEFVLPLATKPSHVLAVQLTNELLADTAAAAGRGGGPEAGGSAAEEKLRSSGEEVTKERYDFRELLDRFMYPFCHVPTFKKMNHILAPLQPGQDQGAQTSDALLTKQERPTADTASATATSALSGDAQLFESADAALLRVGGPASQTDAASSSRGSFFSSLARCSAADSRSRSSASFPAQDVAAAAGGNSIAQELRVEMSQEFNLAPEVILALQSDFEAALVSWHSSSAPDSFRQRVQPAEFRRALDELSSESTLQLFATVVLLLWHWHLPASQHMARGCPVLAYSSYDLCCPARPDQAKADAAAAAAAAPDGASFSAASASERLQQQRILAILQRFSAKYRCLRKTRSGLLFVLPMLLLSLRVLVEQLFARVYPLWTRTQEGRTALLEMDAAVVRLLDPHGYFQRFSCLQSTCGSLDVMLSRQQSMHTPARGHFNDTSPALRASLGQVASIGARLVMQPKAVRRNPRRCTEDAPHPTRQPPRGSRADESDDPQPRAVLAGSGSVDGPVGRRLQLQESEMAAPRQQLLRTQLRQLSYRRKPQPNLSQPGGRTSRSPWLPVPS